MVGVNKLFLTDHRHIKNETATASASTQNKNSSKTTSSWIAKGFKSEKSIFKGKIPLSKSSSKQKAPVKSENAAENSKIKAKGSGFKKTDTKKSVPYYPPRHQELALTKLDLNGKVPFKDKPDSVIVCRHLVTQRLIAQASQPDGKYRFSQDFETLEHPTLIEAAIPLKQESENLRSNITILSNEVHRVKANDLGFQLQQQFKVMVNNQEPVRLFLLSTEEHDMSMRLRVKSDANQNTKYVIEFYDPNYTATHKRVAFSDAQKIAKLDLSDFIGSKQLMQSYFPDNSEAIISLFRFPQNVEQLSKTELATPIANRALASGAPAKFSEVTPHALEFLIESGFTADLRSIKKILSVAPAEKVKILLKSVTAGLGRATVRGFSEAVSVYGEILLDALSTGKITSPEFFKILFESKANGLKSKTVNLILLNGNSQMAAVFGQIISKALDITPMSKKDLIKLLDFKNGNGENIGEAADKKGNKKTVQAYQALTDAVDIPRHLKRQAPGIKVKS